MKNMTFQQMREIIKDSLTVSYWLKGAADALDKRDPVDALKDVEVLLALCKKRLEVLA